MFKTTLMKLDLCAPLFYIKADNIQENQINKELFEKHEEILFCFTLNPQESRNIEPDKEKLLEKLAFVGIKTMDSAANDINYALTISDSNLFTLPAAKYLFNQYRADEPLNRKEWLDIAIEQQKDGLWERNKPDSKLYVRVLFEDGKFATQLLRPLQ